MARPDKSHAADGHVPLENEAAVRNLLQRKPALRRVLKELDLKLSTTGQIMPVPQSACPFRVDGCPIAMDTDLVLRAARRPATSRVKTA